MARIYLKRPNQKRRAFSLYRQDKNPDGSTKNVTLDVDDLDSLNQQYKQKKLTMLEANKIAERIRLRYNIDIGAEEMPETVLQSNLDLLDKYWRYEYSDRYLRCEAAAKNKLLSAVRALGVVDMATASREEISSRIKSLNTPTNIKRTYIQKINQLLKYLNRDIRLRMPREENHDVVFLNDEEFAKVLTHISDDYVRVAAQVAFYTGCRSSEVMAADVSKIRDKSLFVENQYDLELRKLIRTKNGIVRHAYIFDEGFAAIKEWSKIKNYNTSIKQVSRQFKLACMKAFPHNPDKHCSFHGLRHSYAVKLVRFVGLTLTAQSIGDSIKVTEKYYTGFVLRKESIDMIDMMVRGSNSSNLN